jgi:hypothetical protein
MRRRIFAVTAFALARAVTATALAQQASPDLQTGLVGRVVVASRCPVPLGGDDAECPSLPFPTSLTIRSSDGTLEVAQVATDTDGQFSIPLDPGAYLVDTPVLGSLLVTVASDQPTPLIIQIPTATRRSP